MNAKFKNFLALLAVAISVFCYAQTPTLIASGTYKASGSGASGIPTVSINIPAGKNRVMIISTFSERVHSTFNSNFVYNADGATDGDYAHPIFVNGISGIFLSAPWTANNNTNGNSATVNFSTNNTVRYVSDAMGLPTGIATITFTGINLPENSGDEMIVNVAVFENASANLSLLNWSNVSDFNTTNFLTLSGTTPTIPVGNAIGNIVFLGTGGITQSKNVTFSSGWTAIQSDVITNTAGSSPYTLSPNEHDGIGYTTAYGTITSGNPTFTLSRTATNPITEAASANLISILPLARPSVSGTVYRDNNGLTGGINNGGTGGGIWNIANALYVNAVDTNGNVVATVAVDGSGVFTFPAGGSLIEGDAIRFQLSKTQGTVGQPAPAKDLPLGWGTVGESTAGGTSDGTANGEFTLTIGTANSANNTTNRFGVTQTSSDVLCSTGTGGARLLFGFFGDNNQPSGSTAPHLQPTSQGSAISSLITASNMTASSNVSISAQSVGSVTTIRVGNINTSITTPVDYTTYNDYIYSTWTMAANSPIVRLDAASINTVSGGQGANFRARITVYDVAAATETIVLSDELFNATGGTSYDLTGYNLIHGKTYQIRIYLSKGAASGASPLTLDIDNPVFYGTAIPNVVNTNLYTSCSNTTLPISILNSNIASVTPTGYELRWFNASNTNVTALTNVPNGTYTAYYYSTANSCYQPVSAPVTISQATGGIDSDGDGYTDDCDLDDDNDGILDTNECTTTDLVTNGTFTGSANGWTLENSWTYNTNRVANSADGETSRLLQSISNLDKLPGNIVPLTFTVGAQDASNASGNSSALEVRLNGVVYATISNGSARNTSNVTITLPSGVTSNFSTFGTSAVNGYTTQTFTIWIPYTGPAIADLVFRKVGGNDDWLIDDVSIPAMICDTDGDGILDHLDLDSDGDGCPDSIEGAGNFTNSQLTSASGTISSQTPNLNFGVAVDTNGVPTTVGASGQATGQSKDKFKNDCLDSDGDGYPNWQDLDDDNDGILDTDELACATSTDKTLNYFFNTSSGNYINTASPTFFYNYSSLAHQDGTGVTSTIVSDVLRVTGVTTSATRDNNDYLDFPFVISDEGNYALSSIKLRNTGSGRAYKYDVVLSSDNFATSTPLVTGASVTGLDNTIYFSSTFTPVALVPGTIYKLRFYLYNRTGSDPTDFDNMSIDISGCDYKDTDGDGILDHLDLDSDGDGCPDTIEGGGSFTTSQLTTASGTLSSQIPNLNFGVAVDTNGVPTTVGASGQATGQSKDKFKNDCLDSDGDGYPDWQDLDDDNDGIVDLDECTDTRAQRVVWSNSIAGNLDAPTYLSGYTSGTELTAQDATQIGVGIGRTFTGTRQDITGVNSSSEALAIANNEYVEYEINVGNTPFIFTNLGWYVQQSSVSNVGYRFTVHISDNNFISSRNVLNDTQYVPTASGSNMVQLITNGSLYLESSKIYKFRVYFYRTDGNPSNLTFAHDDFKIYGYLECDEDGDGTPNRLDLDSDNDGCLDAIEGGANITTSQLVNSGGTVTVGIGSSATNQNLCANNTCVDANGVPNIVGASGQTVGNSQNAAVSSQCNSFCYKPAVIDAANTYPSKHGITSLGRAGAGNDNWPMVRQSAWTVLEAKTKGFVVNRVKFNSSNQPVADDGTTLVITNPVEGMMVYDITNNCLKVYTSNNGGSTFAWHCMSTQACPQ